MPTDGALSKRFPYISDQSSPESLTITSVTETIPNAKFGLRAGNDLSRRNLVQGELMRVKLICNTSFICITNICQVRQGHPAHGLADFPETRVA